MLLAFQPYFPIKTFDRPIYSWYYYKLVKDLEIPGLPGKLKTFFSQ